MICTSVIPCLSTGLAKNDTIMSMFVLFFWLFIFGHYERLAFFPKWRGGGGGGGRQTLHQSSQHDILVNF